MSMKMSLKDYLQMQLASCNLELYVAIQQFELLRHICKCEGIDNDGFKELCKKHIKYEEPAISKQGNIFYMEHIWGKIVKPHNYEYFDETVLQSDSIYYMALVDYVRQLYKDNPTLFSRSMKTPTHDLFDLVWHKVFSPHADGSGKWRTKKSKLKKKYEEKNDGSYTDYEMILFNYIVQLEHTRMTED
jgi:hypothetical protein